MSFIPYYPKPLSPKKKLYKKGLFNKIRTLIYLNKSPIHATCESSFHESITFDLSPPTIKIIGLANDANMILKDKEVSSQKSYIINEMLKPLLRESIFNTNGEVWKKYRLVMSKGLNTISTKKTFPLMLETVNKFLYSLEEGKNINIEEKMTHITADIIFKTILSSELSQAELKKFVTDFSDFQRTFIKSLKLEILNINFLKRKLNKLGSNIRKLIEVNINDRYYKNKDVYNDSLNEFIKASLSEKELNLSKDEMVDQICMLFLAGHETSAAALSWTFYLLSQDPKTQQDIYKEIKRVIGNREIEISDLKEMHLTSSAFFEAMRLFPPVYILPREKTFRHPRSQKFQKKEHYFINNWVIHRNQKYWHNPNKFCPQRFLKKKYNEYTEEGSYLPFSKGSRACIGKAFAIQEALIILIKIIEKYEILSSKEIPQPYGGLTLRTKKGIKISLKKR